MPGYVDAHHHLWDRSVLRYDWLDDVPALGDRYVLDDYRAATADDPPDLAVFVQAGTVDADGAAEARWVHAKCHDDPRFAGMVVWAPVENGSDAVAAHLGALDGDGIDSIVGVRRLIQSEDPGWCTQSAVVGGIEEVGRRGLVFDLCLFPRHLPDACAIAERLPEVRFVLDHLGKPDIAGGGLADWLPGFRRLARHDNVWCKLSGLVTEADPRRWQVDDLRPFVDAALEAFGPRRLLWGSDWPVVTTVAGHRQWREATDELLAGLSGAERSAVRSGTAADVYGFESAPEGARRGRPG